MKTKRNLSASIPNETRKAVYARDGYRCALCDDTHGLQIHHIVHRSCGGNDTPCNLITLCWRCHAEAHGTWVAERHAVRPPHTAEERYAAYRMLQDEYEQLCVSRLPWGAPSRPAPPRCRSLCCRLMASALFGMRAAPSRRNGGPRPSSALPLFRCRRPRLRRWRRQRGAKACAPAAGFRCAPLCPLAAVVRGQRRGRRQSSAALVQFAQRWGVCAAAVPAAVPARVALRGQTR